MRCFIAVPVKAPLARICVALAQEAGRPVPRENLHLTLQFLGTLAPAQLPAVVALLDQLAQTHVAFTVPLGQAEAFPSPVGPLYVLTVGRSAPLLSLHDQLGQGLVALGLAPQSHAWRPHITLARPGRAAGPGARSQAGVLDVDVVTLYQSLSGDTGPPRYLPLHQARLS